MYRKIGRKRMSSPTQGLWFCVQALSEKQAEVYAEGQAIEIKLMEEQPTNLSTSDTMMRLREALEASG